MNVDITASGPPLDDAVRERVRRRIHFTLARYAGAMTAVSVTLRDLGESFWLCTVVLRPRRRAPLIVEGCDATLHAAADRALSRAGRECRRAFAMERGATARRRHRPWPDSRRAG